VIEHARSVLQLLEMMVKEANLKGLHGSVRIACFRSSNPCASTSDRPVSHQLPSIAVNIIEHFDYAVWNTLCAKVVPILASRISPLVMNLKPGNPAG